MSVWQTSLQSFPDSEFVTKAMQRLIPKDEEAQPAEQRQSS
jgi:hypothetical protein